VGELQAQSRAGIEESREKPHLYARLGVLQTRQVLSQMKDAVLFAASPGGIQLGSKDPGTITTLQASKAKCQQQSQTACISIDGQTFLAWRHVRVTVCRLLWWNAKACQMNTRMILRRGLRKTHVFFNSMGALLFGLVTNIAFAHRMNWSLVSKTFWSGFTMLPPARGRGEAGKP
jgi:hypothetical protein